MPAAPECPNGNATNVTSVLPVTIQDRAYAELYNLAIHDRLRYGDIKNVSLKYGLSPSDYASLRQKLKRNSCHNSISSSVGTDRRINAPAASPAKKPENFNAHGLLYYQTLVLSDSHLEKIPDLVTTRWGLPWYRSLSNASFTLRAFVGEGKSHGKCLVFPHVASWRDPLAESLFDIGWDAQAIASFDECLQINGSTLELAVAIPGVPSGQHFSDKSGLVSIDTDHTPKDSGNVEIKVNIGEFDQRLAAMENQIVKLVTSGGYLGFQQLKDMVYSIAASMRDLTAVVRGLVVGNYVDAKVGNNVAPNIGRNVGTLPPASLVEAPPAVLTTTSPDPIRCPHARELSPGSWYCGPRTIFAEGRARLTPLPCFRPGFEKCDHYV